MKSKTERSGYEECVGVSRLLLQLIGVWPQSHGKGNFFQRNCAFVAPSVLFFMIILPQTRKLMLVWRDFEAVVDILSIGLMMIIVTFVKILRVWLNHADFNVILENIQSDWETATENEQILMWKYARYSRLVATVGLCSLIVDCQLLFLRFIVQYHLDQKMIGENETFIKPLCMSADFYFDVQWSPIYELMMFLVYIAINICVVSYAGYDGIFTLFVLHYTAMFGNLRAEVEQLVEKRADGKFLHVLVPAIERHKYLCRCTLLIEKIYSDVFLLQIIYVSVHLCLQGYEFVVIITSNNGTEDLPQLLHICFYSFTSIFSLFIYCFISEQLRIESGELFTSICKIKWYELSTQESKLLLMMLLRSQHPANISVGKFENLSLEYFCSVLKFCGSFFSVLLAARDKVVSK